MPTLTEDRIKARIADGSIVAITLDTNIFDRYGCNLDFPVIKSLEQFKDGAIQVVFSEIVVSEIYRHICDGTENKKDDGAHETLRKLKLALKQHRKRWKVDFDTEQLLATATRGLLVEDVAQAQIDEFLQSLDAQVLPASGKIDVAGEVIKRYFDGTAPFEKRDAKKSEFPDAFALLSLEKHFTEKKGLLLCVSADKGWQQFGDASASLVVIDELEKALSFFNDAGRHLVDQAINLLSEGNAPALAEVIENAIQARIDDADFNPTCDAHLDYESEPIGAGLLSVDFENVSNVEIISSDDDVVTFTFQVEARANFEAEFRFHSYDSIDKDYVHLSTELAEIEQGIRIKLVVEISREIDPEPEGLDAESYLPRYYEIDFGYVEPFPNEDPTHEKY